MNYARELFQVLTLLLQQKYHFVAAPVLAELHSAPCCSMAMDPLLLLRLLVPTCGAFIRPCAVIFVITIALLLLLF